ncbi:hypothetical protein ABZ672_03860 [Streptomyces mirabilis]|uniref:hypothetical protein n=1 Tax=Streptomyces mirabilis TaxID=68239 RepID=UPI0033CA418A
MLEQELMALAAACGAALVDAVGTDTWTGLRQAAASWFARGDARHERVELRRLDQIVGLLQTAEATEVEQVRIHLKRRWQDRIEILLEDLDDTERTRAVARLRSLLVQHALSTVALPPRPPLQVDRQILTPIGERRFSSLRPEDG